MERRSAYIRQEMERQREVERVTGVSGRPPTPAAGGVKTGGAGTGAGAVGTQRERGSPSSSHSLNTWATDASQILTMTAPAPRGDGRGVGLNGTLPGFPADYEGEGRERGVETGYDDDLETIGSLPDSSTFLRPPSS